jgi:hypothetical protein
MQFVPPERRGEAVPCHYIPLNKAGATVDLLERKGDQEEIDYAVRNWLQREIMQIRGEREETGFSLA